MSNGHQSPGVVACLVGLKGAVYLKRALEIGLPLSRVLTYEQAGDLSDSFTDIRAMALAAGLDLQITKSPQFLANELVFVVGWQFLFKDITPSTIVFHDSLLPRFRGFAPTVTALIRGERQIGVTALLPVDEVDAGPIVAQAAFEVNYPLPISEALSRQATLMAEMSVEIFRAWSVGQLVATEQDASKATYSIWRDDLDFFIDWSLSAEEIARFVDAVGFPYEGARTFINNECLGVASVEVVEDIEFEIRQPGKVWRIEETGPVVVCGSGMVRLGGCTTPDGSGYVVNRLRSRFGSQDQTSFNTRLSRGI